jgi:oxygen-independent coproporphyrinogen III oxidase
MFGLPGRSADDALADADALLELAPEHLSAYCLSVEPGTPLARDLAAGRRPAPDDDEAAEAYGRLRARLLGAGYEHYELSNFARPGRESAHNGLYWSGGEVLGCGPSAASFLGGERTRNAEATEAYCERMERTGGAVVETERLVGEAAAAEYLVFALRRTRGVGARSFRERTGFALEDFRAGEIRSLKERGLLEERGGRLRLTERALFVSDAVFRELI